MRLNLESQKCGHLWAKNCQWMDVNSLLNRFNVCISQIIGAILNEFAEKDVSWHSLLQCKNVWNYVINPPTPHTTVMLKLGEITRWRNTSDGLRKLCKNRTICVAPLSFRWNPTNFKEIWCLTSYLYSYLTVWNQTTP